MPRSVFRQLVVLSLLVLATSAGTDAQTISQLLGTWEAVRVLDADGEETPDSNDSVAMTFTDDGRLLLRLNQSDRSPSIKASYRVEHDVLVLVNEDGEEQRVRFWFEGDELALRPETGQEQTAYLRRRLE